MSRSGVIRSLSRLLGVGEVLKRLKTPVVRAMEGFKLSAQADRVMASEEWLGRWQEGRIGFHQPCVHEMLGTNIDKVVCGREGVRFFFPLCGKAVDMKWLADMGHTVVGVEICDTAIRQFFEEQGLSYKEEAVPAVPGAKLFKVQFDHIFPFECDKSIYFQLMPKMEQNEAISAICVQNGGMVSTDGKISLYQCNIYDFSSAIGGQFGGIWDRGSLVAINPCDREKYAKLILSLMDKDCRYLLDTLEYNPKLYDGPPFFVPDEQVRNLYDLACDIEMLQAKDALTGRYREWGLDSLTEKVFLLKPKAS